MAQVDTRRIGQTIIVALSGRLDSINTPQVQAQLLDEAYIAPDQTLILNMANVYYLSAAGLRLLRRLHERPGGVCIVSPSARVREVLSITGLDVVYRLYATPTAALHSFQPVTNAHTHLDLSWLQQSCPDVTGLPFAAWLRERLDAALLKADQDQERRFQAAAEAGLQTLIESGTTVVGDVSRHGLSIMPLLASGLRGIVYLEMQPTHPHHWEGHFQTVCDQIEYCRGQVRGSSAIAIGLALHAPYALHPALWERALRYAADEKLPLCIDAAQSLAEVEYLRDGSGDLVQYYQEAAAAVPPPGKSPIAYLDSLGALALKPLLIHAVQVDDEDIQRIRAHGCTVVHCPRSDLRLRCGRMPLERFLAQDVPVLLGTDSLASAPSLNVMEELDVAAALHYGYVAPERLRPLLYQLLPGMA